MNEYILKILSTKNSHNFPIRYLMVYPLPHISYRANFVYFCVICISKTPTFVLLFYTFSYFITTFPKILVLLLSYFSTQGCQKACVEENTFASLTAVFSQFSTLTTLLFSGNLAVYETNQPLLRAGFVSK